MRAFLVFAVSTSAALLSGCSGMQFGSKTQTVSVQGAAFQGRVHGGENPIIGSSVYLYAANSTGYGNASVSLLKSPGYVTTDSNGAFTITGDYTCPAANSQVYLYAVGGNPGLAQGTNNSSAGMLAGLGSCGSLASSTYVVINEVSTIATAYAVAGYATDAKHVSSSGSALALTGMANAFAAIPNLEQVTTAGGVTSFMGIANATTPAGNGAVPQAEINTLANILAACTNSTGTVTGPTNATPCYTLFTNAESGGSTGTQPTDTATAAINIAHNPEASGVLNLYGLQTANSPFQPTLSYTSGLLEFAIGINYSGGGINTPAGIAVDASGNVWTGNLGTSISELGPTGAPISPATGFTGGGLAGPDRIAIDKNGNAWVANNAAAIYGGSNLSEFNSSGQAISGATGFTGGGLNGPYGIALDASGNVWTANKTGNSLSEFNPSGMAISPSTGYTAENLSGLTDLAIDTSGNIWVAGSDEGVLPEFNSSGSLISSSLNYDGELDSLGGIAIDPSGDVWIGNLSTGLIKFGPDGSLLFGSSGGGVLDGRAVAIDSAGNAWFANGSAIGISEMNPSDVNIGYGLDAGTAPAGIAIDGSGNVWASTTGAYPNSNLIEFVGAAVPVVTPIVANLLPPYGGHAVNEP